MLCCNPYTEHTDDGDDDLQIFDDADAVNRSLPIVAVHGLTTYQASRYYEGSKWSCWSSVSLSSVPDFFDRNKILSGGDLSHYQVPHCIRVFFYFVWFVFIYHNFQFYFELCTYYNILDIYLS